jgi:hypothetical protein
MTHHTQTKELISWFRTGFTPFFMVYEVKAVLPIDLKYGSPRV